MRYIDSGERDPIHALGSWMQGLEPAEVSELRLQTGFFGIAGIAFLRPVLDLLRQHNRITHCLIGSNDTGTGGEDVRALVDVLGLPRPGARLAVCAFGNAFFHPKVIHVRRHDGSQAAYIGSANLTESGVGGRHVEAGVLFDTADGDPATELEKVAAAVDAWFSSTREGCYPVGGSTDVDQLVAQGILASEAVDTENRQPSRRSSKGAAPYLPTLVPLLKLPSNNSSKKKSAAPPSSPTRGDSIRPDESTPSGASSHYFMMELSKNRISSSSYQADLGKRAFTDFFGGQIGGGVDIQVNTVVVGSTSRAPRSRQLVDVKSRNYRLEIDFPGKYPSSGRPIVTFGKVSSNEFDCLLLMPGDLGYPQARETLSSFARPVSGNSMRRALVSRTQLASTWPACPLL